jgi:hypothetical protein
MAAAENALPCGPRLNDAAKCREIQTSARLAEFRQKRNQSASRQTMKTIRIVVDPGPNRQPNHCNCDHD